MAQGTQTAKRGSLRALLCAPIWLAATVLLAGCGVVHKDIQVTAQFQAGGFPPNSSTTLGATQITTPLEASAGDVSKLSSVTLTWATLQTVDGTDLSFLTGGATISLSGNGLPTVELARLPPPGVVGKANFTIEADTDLRAYLEGGGTISATLDYTTAPVPARGLELTLNIHAVL